MKVGDLVRKKAGASTGEVGLIIAMVVNPPMSVEKQPVTILTVVADGIMKNWYSSYVEVINERK